MDVEDDRQVESVADFGHGLCEAVSRCCLDDVLGQLPAVGLNPAPFVGFLVDAAVLEAGVSEAVSAWLHIRVADEPSARESDGHRGSVHGQGECANVEGLLRHADLLRGGLELTPEGDYVWVGFAPLSYYVGLFVPGEPLALAAHLVEGVYSAAVSQCEDCNLSLLAEVAVQAVFLDRHFEHIACCSAVDVTAVPEDFEDPFLACHPRYYSGLDGAEIADGEGLSFRGYKCSSDELAQDVGYVAVAHLDELHVSVQQCLPCKVQIVDVVLRQILHLDEPSGPATSPGSVELGDSAGAPVGSGDGLHRGVFLAACLPQLVPDVEDPQDALVGYLFLEVGDVVFVEAGEFDAGLLCNPCFELADAVRVLKSGELDSLNVKAGLVCRVDGDGVLDELAVNQDAAVVDLLIDGV